MKRIALALTMIGVLAAVLAAPAYARRTVPVGFFGVVIPPELNTVSDATLDQQMGLMASSGVESIRLDLPWLQLEPAPGSFDFSTLDRLVGTASRHHLRAIVNVSYTPAWASSQPGAAESWRYPPKNVSAYTDLMRRLVLRYGPSGAFFRANPTLPRVPVREWQVWNEQDAPWYWTASDWWRSYTSLLRQTYPAIHRLDRGAEVIAGSLVASSATETPWLALDQMYRAGAKRYFDAISVHPFADTGSSVGLSMSHLLTIVQRMRTQMRRFGDARKPLLVTEMTWSSALGKVPRAALLGFETTPRGQAQRLAAAYGNLAKQRTKLGLTQVFWLAWSSAYDATGDLQDMIFRFTGLLKYAGGPFSPMPLLGTYASTAARYEGCRKGPTASCR